MVSPMKYYEKDPMYPRFDRGKGYYYKRSHDGNKNWYSFYKIDRDSAIERPPINPYTSYKYRHAGDRKDSTYITMEGDKKVKWSAGKKFV
jgi:hypothetical protein